MPLLLVAALLVLAFVNLQALRAGGDGGGLLAAPPAALLQQVAAPVAAAAGALALIMKLGRNLVDQPVLLPSQAVPWH